MLKASLFCCASLLFTAAGCGERQSNKGDTAEQTAEKTEDTVTEEVKTILFFGNSLTAGYGLDTAQAFPALIQGKIDSLGLPYRVVNAGLSGETSAGGLSRIDWILRQPVDIFVLELGANDALRGIPPSETSPNLQAIIDKVKARYPDAKLVILGMEAPPNMGEKYTSEFRRIFRRLASANNLALVPFLLEGVGGVPELNQSDGVHPTARGHEILAENVWEVLKEVLVQEDRQTSGNSPG